MLPVLFNIGPISISSFGFFLGLSVLIGTFLVFRVAKAFDLNEDKITDIALYTFFGGLLGARLVFIALNYQAFTEISRIFLLNKYPGFSLWGGILGGLFCLWFFSKRAKFNFWQIADFIAVAFLFGMFLGNIGCFFGGCNLGAISNSPLATSVVGLIGKRLPLSLFEGLALLFLFLRLWPQTIKFHFAGKILALTLMGIGVVKFILEFYRQPHPHLIELGFLTPGHLLSLMLFILGIMVFYYKSKRSIITDLRALGEVVTSSKRRQIIISVLKKTFYNYKVNGKIKIDKLIKFLLNLPSFLKRRLNVKSIPKDIV